MDSQLLRNWAKNPYQKPWEPELSHVIFGSLPFPPKKKKKKNINKVGEVAFFAYLLQA